MQVVPPHHLLAAFLAVSWMAGAVFVKEALLLMQLLDPAAGAGPALKLPERLGCLHPELQCCPLSCHSQRDQSRSLVLEGLAVQVSLREAQVPLLSHLLRF